VGNDRKQKYDQLVFNTSADVPAKKLGDVATVSCRTYCEMSPVLSLLKDGRDATSGLPQLLSLGCLSCYLWAAPVATSGLPQLLRCKSKKDDPAITARSLAC
ncbi:hypothetical protein Bpfe_019352, partial [Biomphalaria pfeifferi]